MGNGRRGEEESKVDIYYRRKEEKNNKIIKLTDKWMELKTIILSEVI